MKIAHTYCLPYYIDKNKKETFVLMGLKKKYNKRSGYIHSNPGQLVLIGGNLKKHISLQENVKQEFEEETGHILDMKKIYIDPNYKVNYATAYYRCSPSEYRNFDKLINSNERFPEMDKLCWISFNNVINIMVRHNKNVISNIDKLSLEYTNQFKNKRWNLSQEINELIWYIKGQKGLNKKIRNKDIVDQYIIPKLDNKHFFNQVNGIIFKYINKNSKYDWFENSLFYFREFHNYHLNKKNKSPKKKSKSPPRKSKSPPRKSKSPPKKKSKSPPKKKSKSPPKKKRKYIPPHLRK
jgi:8-oxo-dGTP pyrophosphatase MutT (NUDIX family)